jgi:hypothetical protein
MSLRESLPCLNFPSFPSTVLTNMTVHEMWMKTFLNMPSLLYQYIISAKLNNKMYQTFINLTSPYRVLSCPHVLCWFHSVRIHIRILSKRPSYKVLAIILKLVTIIFCKNPPSKLKQTIMDTNWPWITLYYRHSQLKIQISITVNNHSLLTSRALLSRIMNFSCN